VAELVAERGRRERPAAPRDLDELAAIVARRPAPERRPSLLGVLDNA
jgi:hypothetical protein